MALINESPPVMPMNDIASAGGANRVFAQAGWITSSQNEAARACGIPRFVDKARPKAIIMALLSQNLLIFSILFILGQTKKPLSGDYHVCTYILSDGRFFVNPFGFAQG